MENNSQSQTSSGANDFPQRDVQHLAVCGGNAGESETCWDFWCSQGVFQFIAARARNFHEDLHLLFAWPEVIWIAACLTARYVNCSVFQSSLSPSLTWLRSSCGVLFFAEFSTLSASKTNYVWYHSRNLGQATSQVILQWLYVVCREQKQSIVPVVLRTMVLHFEKLLEVQDHRSFMEYISLPFRPLRHHPVVYSSSSRQ